MREAQTKQKSDQTLNQATIESKEQASKKARFDVDRANRALTQMTERAPSAGTISLLQHWSGSNMTAYRPGDRAWPGSPIAELPDATTLRISARVDETERGRLAAKQPVTVQLNAIPDRQFTGHIEQISAIASLDFSSGWPITRNFILEIVLDQTDPQVQARHHRASDGDRGPRAQRHHPTCAGHVSEVRPECGVRVARNRV